MQVGRPDVAGGPLLGRLPGVLAAIADVGDAPGDDAEACLRKRLLVVLALSSGFAAVLWGVVYVAIGAASAAIVPAAYAVGSIANYGLLAWRKRFDGSRTIQLALILLLPWLLALQLGGLGESSAIILWSALAPLSALLLDSRRAALAWHAAFLLLVVLAAVAGPRLDLYPLPAPAPTVFLILNIGAVMSLAFGLLHYFVRQTEFFQQRSEMLLLNILPKEISEILKDDQQHPIAAHHEEASILFADVVQFTRLSATMTPMELVGMLDEVFLAFDFLAGKHGIEKIKTIGDCYMVAAGVPTHRGDHAEALVEMALDMRAVVAAQSFRGHRLAFRIGINSGPVVAGVIGRQKFIYDLWGNAVNIASRMESHGTDGAIQITRATHDRVAHRFDCEPRGIIAVKGGGDVEVWHVTGRKAARAAA
jgi:guanylate cyclase